MMDQKRNTIRIFVFIICFTLATLSSSFFLVTPLVGVFFILIGIFVFLGEKVWRGEVIQAVFLISLVFVSLGFGFLRYAAKDFHISSPYLETRIGEKIELAGYISSEPEQRENSTRFVMKTGGEKILVNTDLYSPAQYGDEVKVSGKLEKPGIIEGEDGRLFDYGKFLSKEDIYYTLSFASSEVVSGGHGNILKAGLLQMKQKIVSKMKEILPEPESSLLAGLIVAGKGAMPKNILEEFQRAGVVHIVVLSGYNITIIADFLRKFFETFFLRFRFSFLPIQKVLPISAAASIIGIIFFVIMTGAQATVVRAAIMVLVVIGAKLFGRTYSASRALISAAFIMIVHNPKILVFDSSFQLSFLATLALIHVSPVVEKYLKKVPEKWGLKTMLATTLATQMVVLPYLVYLMGNFSLVSLPANILILLFVPVTMLLGFLSVVVATISSLLALPFSYLTHLLLSWILGVSGFLGNLPFASIQIPPFSFFWVLLVYLVLTFILLRLRNSSRHFAN